MRNITERNNDGPPLQRHAQFIISHFAYILDSYLIWSSEHFDYVYGTKKLITFKHAWLLNFSIKPFHTFNLNPQILIENTCRLLLTLISMLKPHLFHNITIYHPYEKTMVSLSLKLVYVRYMLDTVGASGCFVPAAQAETSTHWSRGLTPLQAATHTVGIDGYRPQCSPPKDISFLRYLAEHLSLHA